MVQAANFDRFQALNKSENYNDNSDQVYEEVDGFESLKKIQTRTTSYTCSPDSTDYAEHFLMGRPLPWVVRVYFQSESSIKGTLCSGKSRLDLSL